ncbi:protein BANP-like isoform X2 [Hypanus sabinus]|nr:protein BANP-like isoform X2 [Hypanus sabinus]XP_059807453.1 protein BANP-like isoform X2 [Hypanus sabinus]XP_059807454.1 protein BANP-like isoform X2 [Hypanus sabinus]XP_059807455.1 protein BANP-like isoform X2 [Hypanus sabinus]XP_059807456.1 protein BANP-like isoform X2 [Hypanus sabinus]XP_059807457.1 protein BANP-like isoform X2 [Hypanus sabinus]
MAEQPLAEMVEIAVRQFASDADGTLQSSHTDDRDDASPSGKRRRVEVPQAETEEGEDSIQALLYSASKTLCLRLDAIEADLNSMEDKCKCLRAKVDLLANQNVLRAPVAELQRPEGQQPAGSSSATVTQEASSKAPQSEEEFEGNAEPAGEGVIPGVRIVALCADGREGAEGRQDSSVALLPDATNLLYQLMY